MNKAVLFDSLLPKNVNQVYKFIAHFQNNSINPDKLLYQSNPIPNDFDIAEVLNNFSASTFTLSLPLDLSDESLIEEDFVNRVKLTHNVLSIISFANLLANSNSNQSNDPVPLFASDGAYDVVSS